MKWGEFSSLLSGLNGETPLGNIVRIRSEKDSKIIKNFTKEEKRIRSEWLLSHGSQIRCSEAEYQEAMKGISKAFQAMAEGR